MIRRRPTQIFSLAFLDCICCGFGAIILIFVLSVAQRDQTAHATLEDLQRMLAERIAAVAALNGKEVDLSTQHAKLSGQIVDEKMLADKLRALLDDLDRQLALEKKGQKALLVDIDDLKKELGARQKKPDMVLPDVKPLPVGVPVGSNYIVFIMDTSGSMRDPNTYGMWPIVLRKIEDVLDTYPHVDGIQVMDADGRFMMGRDSQWMSDNKETRDGIRRVLRRYEVNSASNPVPGIARALRTLQDKNNPDQKMGIYYFGDEFVGTADAAIKMLDQLNPADENGHRRVVINAIGFPTTIDSSFSMGDTGLKYANLMREVCYQHGGAFIALQDL